MTAASSAKKPRNSVPIQVRDAPDLNDDGEDVFVAIPANFRLSSGAPLPDAQIQIRRVGAVGGPLVVVAGGISAGRDVCGAQGWWRENAGASAGIDLHRYKVLGFEFAPVGNHRVAVTPADQARLLLIAFDALALARVHAFVGASYGGMVGLALAALAPARVDRLCVISAAHRPAPLAQAWRGVQRRIVERAIAWGDPAEGLALARQLAMITYRSAEEFDARFRCRIGAGGRSDLDDYLIARGAAYAAHVAPLRWLSLSQAIDRFHVAPEAVKAPTTLIACPSDQVAPISEMRALAAHLPNLAAFHELPSLYGHDAFLKEAAQLRPMLNAFLESEIHAEA